MALTVDAAFNGFFDAINLAGDHRETANTRREAIVSLLKNDFDIVDSFATGSIPKYTALAGNCDLDVIVVLHYGKHMKDKKPSEVLSAVRSKLSKYRTGARRNGQAVTLSYTTWPDVDIVPVYYSHDDQGNITHYNVPNEKTETWIKARPKEFAASIEEKASVCGQNFRRIIKMAKHWNRTHGDYLQSYHVEVLALKVFPETDLSDTPWQVFRFFEDAKALLATPLWHDQGFADAYLSWSDRQEALKRFDTAISYARSGWHELYKDKKGHGAAIEQWKKLFGDKFPPYG
ncbi:MAG: nucleotidyltransferase [Proteobacteria bacterium]|nr:nucleotidyltransferase [Pseudomonadota bacterium]